MGELIQKCSECSEIYHFFPFSYKHNLHQISKHWTAGQRTKLSVLLEQNLPLDPVHETFHLIDDYYYTIITTISRTEQQPNKQEIEQHSDASDDTVSRNIVEDFIDHDSQEIYIENTEREEISIQTELTSCNDKEQNSEEFWLDQSDDEVDSVNNSPINDFSCKICDKILKQKSTFISHMKTVHRIQKTDTINKENIAATIKPLNIVDDEDLHRSKSPGDDDDYILDDDQNFNDDDDDNSCDEDYQVKKPKSTKQLSKTPSNEKQSRKTIQKPLKSVGMKTGELYTCEYCSKPFTRKRYYEAHTARHRDLKDSLKKRRQTKKHLCPICGKRYPEGYHLRLHMFVHGVERPLKCDICGKGFVIKKTLREHMHIHTGARPYMCDVEGCGKSFTFAQGKRQHYNTVHSGNRPFECEKCERRFAKKSTLKEHLRDHTGERPYACDLCPMKFKLQPTLRVHRRTHTGEKPFVCPLCNKGFIIAYKLKVHLAAKKNCALVRKTSVSTVAGTTTNTENITQQKEQLLHIEVLQDQPIEMFNESE